MRIAVVSAHYPPNFTSGGTLIPQRIADGFAARGNEVFVFAGALDAREPDMWSWTERADSGVEITWTVINSMIDWAGEENYRNPRVEAAFAQFLRRVRPDVVHIHSLQSFGGGIVSLAKAAGAAVVLTMHDMWWWCARQFLAELDLRPCTPVVSCGICACEKDNGWLIRRNRMLAAHLDNVDVVLAPSTTMLELLKANGVDPARLRLDENATVLESAPGTAATNNSRSGFGSAGEHSARPRPSDGPVRFVYAGGPHPLKGALVTMAAAQLLGQQPGWELDVYGMELPADVPAQVRSLPPYPADQVSSVLERYDVLLMTSVATESYSMITREALNVGTVVISGDNPGPTEVVRDGQNGLVVPRGDAEALADAMRRLINDPDLLARLRPTRGAIALRTLEQQLDGLAQLYTELLPDPATSATPATPATPAMSATADVDRPISRVLLLSGINGAPLRYRARLPQEALAEIGVRMDVCDYRDVEALRLARSADAVVLYRVPATEQILDLIDMLRRRDDPVPILSDIDDLVFDPTVESELHDVLSRLTTADRELYWRGVRRYRTTLETADAYIGSTAMLCTAVEELIGIPAHQFANGVGVQLARVSDAHLRRPRAAGPTRIGYLSGTNTHNEDWAYIEPAVLQVMRQRPDIELWIGGLLETSKLLDVFSDRVVRMPMVPWHELPAILRDLDVNLAPLAPGSRFNEAKSSIKWLEAALVSTPTVASPTEPFRADIDDRKTGLLAQTVSEWESAILELVDSPALTHRIGHAARSSALLRYSPQLQARRYLQILEQARRQVAVAGHRDIFTNWQPVYDSEPFVPLAVEPYLPVRIELAAAEPTAAPPRNTARILRDYRTNARNHLRSEGVGRTARKAAQVAFRAAPRAVRRVTR